MKLIIETGSGAHATSSAHLQAMIHGGDHDKKKLYELKDKIVATEWDTSKQKERWVKTQHELPEGTEILVKGQERTGNRGRDVDTVDWLYRLDPSAEVIEEYLNVGLRRCLIKGRLILVKDYLAEKTAAINTEEGF